MHRRLLALGFYAGSALVCGGIVGVWTRWSLGWRDPFVWAAMFVVEGKHWYTRPILLSYWALLAVISVAGWSRQLVRARRHRRYDPPSQPTRAERHMVAAPHQGTSLASAPVALAVPASGPGAGGGQDTNSSGFATMMDAADQRLPTFSVNARRKFFHALAVVMFVPGIAIDVSASRSPRLYLSLMSVPQMTHAHTAGIHPLVIQRRICPLQFRRVCALLCPMALRRIGPSVPQRIPRFKRFRNGHPIPLLPVGRMRQPAMDGRTSGCA